MDLVSGFALLEKVASLVEQLQFDFVHDFLHDVVGDSVVDEVDVPDDPHHEHLPLVLVVRLHPKLHAALDEGVSHADSVEGRLFEFSTSGVVETFHSCCSRSVFNQSDFAEILPCSYGVHTH